jgi:hypothetical protein
MVPLRGSGINDPIPPVDVGDTNALPDPLNSDCVAVGSDSIFDILTDAVAGVDDPPSVKFVADDVGDLDADEVEDEEVADVEGGEAEGRTALIPPPKINGMDGAYGRLLLLLAAAVLIGCASSIITSSSNTPVA